ncbi:MAG TPA: SDR family NAD(P)-dependent oxidoreductase [Acetobacteraceae bacterium]|nr:SDR family NAD(P)-dependent oxidoreductase [Acetobacteraceae bacterium]
MSETILITGATAGLGAAFARRFARDGHRVIATGRRQDRLDELRAELGEAVLPWALDVTDKEAVAALPRALPADWREVSVLVNNAGLALGTAPSFEADLKDWDTMVATNITGLIHMTHAFLPGMVARNRGTIINIGSTAGSYAYAGGHVYGASKAFVRQFSLALRSDLAGRNVRVTDVEPGLIGGSEFSLVRFKGDPEKASKPYEGVTPLSPEDIAETCSWIVGLPPHVNVNRIELMPTCQAPAGPTVKRNPG